MNKYLVTKAEIFFPLLVAILYFLVQKEVLNVFVFLIPTLILGLYFFPVRPLLKIEILRKNSLPNKLVLILAHILFSIILTLAVIIHFNSESGFYGNLLVYASVLNVFLAIYFHFSGSNRRVFLLHIGFIILTSALSAV